MGRGQTARLGDARSGGGTRLAVRRRMHTRHSILLLAVLATGCLRLPHADDPDCSDTCRYARDGECDDGGPDALYDVCALGSDCSDCGPGSRGPTRTGEPVPGGPGAPPTGGTCVGVAVQAYELDDAESCRRQGGDWSSTYGECHGSGYGCAGRLDRDACWALIGCEWEDADGLRAPNPLTAGRCEGTVPVCSRMAVEDECREERTCEWLGDDCEDANSLHYVNNADCAGLTAWMQSQSLNPNVAHSACLRSYGCRWVHGDGTVEAAFDGREPTLYEEPTLPSP